MSKRKQWRHYPALRGPHAHVFFGAKRLADSLGLYVLVEGTPAAPSWVIYDRHTGKNRAVYTPADRVLRIDERRVTCADAREALRRASGHFDAL